MRTALLPYWSRRHFTPDLFSEMDKFFDDMGRANVTPQEEQFLSPECDIQETEEHYMLSVDLPGMKKENIKIEYADNVLTVSGERKREMSTDSKNHFHRTERSYGSFKRSFGLPVSLDADKIEAHYEDGVLALYLPKTQAAKAKSIEIKSERGGFFNKLLGETSKSSEAKKA